MMSASGQRTFPPLYKSDGNESMDRLAFFHTLERLKVRMFSYLVKPLLRAHSLVITSRLRSAQVG